MLVFGSVTRVNTRFTQDNEMSPFLGPYNKSWCRKVCLQTRVNFGYFIVSTLMSLSFLIIDV